jgi:hypothetical protein
VLIGAVVLTVVAYFVFSALDPTDKPATFESTLQDMRNDFGEDSAVLSIRPAEPNGIVWEVLGSPGRVTRRTYSVEKSTDASGKVTNRDRSEEDAERAATAADRKLAKITLGELELTVLKALCEKTGIDRLTGDFEFKGEKWTLFNRSLRYRANYDGTKVEKISGESDPLSAKFARCDF